MTLHLTGPVAGDITVRVDGRASLVDDTDETTASLERYVSTLVTSHGVYAICASEYSISVGSTMTAGHHQAG